jgi:prepilin-type N-terminal cleavage/methylation domain-containing protein
MLLMNKNKQGFTLVEMILALAMLFVLFGIASPFYQKYQSKNDLDLATITVVQNLRRVQTLAQGMDANSSWGLYVGNSQIVVFRGTSYAARNSAFDEIFVLPDVVVPSGLSEIVFTKFTGLPASVGTVTLTNTSINEVKNITINSKGMVDY